MEDGFVEGEEAVVGATFAEGGALFVYGKVHDGGDVVDDVEGVFEPDFHVVFGGFFLHPAHVVDCVGVAKVEAVVVLLGRVSMNA